MPKVSSGEKVAFNSPDIIDALRALLPYGGDQLGFIIAPTDELLDCPSYTDMNQMVGNFVAAAVSRLAARRHFYTHELSTQWFGSYTAAHCDGLNLPESYLQVNTLEQFLPAMPHARATLKAYELDPLHLGWIRSAAEEHSRRNPITTMRAVPGDIHDDATECGASHTLVLDQAPDETIVFINGYAGDAVEPADHYYSHSFCSIGTDGNPVQSRRPVTYGRVGTF